MDLRGKKVIFLGDSITEGVGASCEAARYTCVLKEKAGLREIRNYGISGTRLARQQQPKEETMYWDTNAFTERYQSMEDEADIVVVFGGTNDYGHGDAPFGTEEDRTIDTYCGAVHCLMRGLIEKYPAAAIVFMTPLHRQNDLVGSAANQRPLKDYVEVIRKTAEQYAIPVLDLFAASGIQPDIEAQRERFCPDGLHPNDAGNLRIAERLQAFLETL